MTDRNSGDHGKEKNLDPTDRQTDCLPVPKTGIRRHQEGAGPAPIRLRRLALARSDGSDDEGLDLSEIIIELPMSELASLLPQHLAIRLYNLVRGLFEIPDETSFPYCLDEIVRNKNLLSALRARLAHINNLTELITDPPAILIDERHQLFFYRSIPVTLRPISFSYLLLLSKTPKEFVMREVIYNHLWPGQINYEGTNKPYERQISDHKRKLIAEIKEGVTGKVEIKAGEMETLISTWHKRGYMLNFAKKNVLLLKKKDFLLIVFLFILDWDQILSDLLLDVPELFFMC